MPWFTKLYDNLRKKSRDICDISKVLYIFALTKTNKMNKLQIQKQFIASLPENTTREDAWDQFKVMYNEYFVEDSQFIRRGDFNHTFKLITTGQVKVKPIQEEVMVKHNEPAFELQVVKMSECSKNIPMSFLQPLKTNTAIDNLLSKRGGAMPGTVTMITGESGAGKTTVSTNIAEMIKQHNPGKTAGFISGEMDKLDWFEECADNKMLSDLDTIFLLEYLDAPNFIQILEEALRKWDFCVVDSFEAILDQIKEVSGWSSKKAEAEFIKMLRKAASETGVSLFVIQQYTKGGTYVGSTKIKHLTTAMVYVRFDETGKRYIVYDKNRRNGSMINRKLYFTKNKVSGMIEFDENRFENDTVLYEFSEAEKATFDMESSIFNDILKSNADFNSTHDEDEDDDEKDAAETDLIEENQLVEVED